MIEIVQATGATDEVRRLVEALEATLSAEYEAEQRHGLALDALFQGHIRFFVARRDAVALGCGGVAFLDGFAEVKRMFVAPEARGTGVVQALLARIEHEARAAGLPWLRLETGDKQVAAIRAYARDGFRPCGPFGPYAAMPAAAVATSVFMEKPLAS